MKQLSSQNPFIELIELNNCFPFFKIIRNFEKFSSHEQKKLLDFFSQLGFCDFYKEIYLQLVDSNMDIYEYKNTDIQEFSVFLDFIFRTQSYFTFQIIQHHPLYQHHASFFVQRGLSSEKVIQIISEYIYQSLKSLIVDFEVKRISKGIFNIIKS